MRDYLKEWEDTIKIPRLTRYYYSLIEGRSKKYNDWGLQIDKTFFKKYHTKPALFKALSEYLPSQRCPALLGWKEKEDSKEKLPIFFDASAQNTLVAGMTRSGKTTWISSMLISLMHFSHPEYLKIAIADPKSAGFKHFLGVATLAKTHEEIVDVLKKLNDELTLRIKKSADPTLPSDARGFNELAYKTRKADLLMPFIVFVFDEFADFMVHSESSGEQGAQNIAYIQRLASVGLGLGISLIFATQAPYREFIKGVIKNNFENRICFRVRSRHQEELMIEGIEGDITARDLKTGEFIIGNGSHKSKLNAFESTPLCIKNAVSQWKMGGYDFSL